MQNFYATFLSRLFVKLIAKQQVLQSSVLYKPVFIIYSQKNIHVVLFFKIRQLYKKWLKGFVKKNNFLMPLEKGVIEF